MTTYYATLKGEDGSDFVREFKANSKAKAWARVKELYPESRCMQLESQAQLDRADARIYRWHVMAMDNYEGDY
jgi:hypothetical protein